METGRGSGYAFDELPVVGDWGRRPLELATLRLQNMIGVSLQNWDALRPRDDQLAVLTQLGGLAIGDGDALSAARRVFASGDAEGALDGALDAVKAAASDEEREAARELCVTIIDAMGPGKESLRARKRLASVLF